MTSEYQTVRDVAQLLKVTEYTVRNRVNSGEWPASRVGRQIRFSPAQLDQILRSLAQGSRASRPGVRRPGRRARTSVHDAFDRLRASTT